MKSKYLAYAMLPAVALALAGATTVSAHGLFGWGGATPEQIVKSHQDMFAKQSEMLGISVEEVKNAWAQGKTLLELANEKGITEAQLKAKMLEQKKAQLKTHLQTLVDQGILTQTQADGRLKIMEDRLNSNKMGKMGRHGKMMGFGW